MKWLILKKKPSPVINVTNISKTKMCSGDTYHHTAWKDRSVAKNVKNVSSERSTLIYTNDLTQQKRHSVATSVTNHIPMSSKYMQEFILEKGPILVASVKNPSNKQGNSKDINFFIQTKDLLVANYVNNASKTFTS